jgi:hypothetical protein
LADPAFNFHYSAMPRRAMARSPHAPGWLRGLVSATSDDEVVSVSARRARIGSHLNSAGKARAGIGHALSVVAPSLEACHTPLMLSSSKEDSVADAGGLPLPIGLEPAFRCRPAPSAQPRHDVYLQQQVARVCRNCVGLPSRAGITWFVSVRCNDASPASMRTHGKRAGTRLCWYCGSRMRHTCTG